MRYLLVVIAALTFAGAIEAQVHVNLNLNIGNQPVWGPVGYDHAENYYFPDIDVYYCVPTHLYYFNDGRRWISRSSLPPRFHDFDLYRSYKVVVNERNPWRNPGIYREKYSSFKGRHDQEVIRDSHDSKYYVIKNHPEHDKWVKDQRHDNGRGQRNDNVRGQNNDNGRGQNNDRGNKDKRPDNRRDNNDNSRH